MKIVGFNIVPLVIGAALGAPLAWFFGGWAAILFVIALGAGYELWLKIRPTTVLTLGDSQAFGIGGILSTVAVLVFK